MTGADWIILVVILLSVVQAASAGFFHEIFGLAGLVFGYLLAAWQYWRLAAWFSPYLKSEWLGDIAGFLLFFLGVMILAGIAGRIVRWIVKRSGLSFLDRLLGGFLGLLRGLPACGGRADDHGRVHPHFPDGSPARHWRPTFWW